MPTSNTKLQPSALGLFVLIVPSLDPPFGYCVHSFSRSGRWVGGAKGTHAPWTRAEALRERRKILQHHRDLAQQRDARRRKIHGQGK